MSIIDSPFFEPWQVIILKIWGSTKSASIIQLHHFTFSIGAFIAPLIVRPFFENSDEGVCDAGNDQEACVGIGDENIILAPYLIGMAIMLTASALVLWLFCINIVERIQGIVFEYILSVVFYSIFKTRSKATKKSNARREKRTKSAPSGFISSL